MAARESSSCGRRCWLSSSTQYGLTAAATPDRKLISFRSASVHCLQTTKTNINSEASLSQLKTSDLPLRECDELVALSSSCDGRLLSVLVDSSNGPFVHVYDFCALSPDFASPVGPFHSLRLSAVEGSRAVALEWNPFVAGVFAVTTSDGSLSAFSVSIEEPGKVTIIGTTELKVPGTCMSWSPKGKQLVVGDFAGCVLQFKPEMGLVRSIPPPNNIESMRGVPLRCVGVCWLATTDFLVAYSPVAREDVNVSLLCAKKDSPIKFTHFDDVTFSLDRCSFPQQMVFQALLQWHIVLCCSSRSCEVAVIGKRNNEWRWWTLDDSARIELPVNSSHDESFPIGISLDLSSTTPVRIGDDVGTAVPPCPVVMILSSHGLLLSFNAISANSALGIITRPPLALPGSLRAGNPPQWRAAVAVPAPVKAEQIAPPARMNSPAPLPAMSYPSPFKPTAFAAAAPSPQRPVDVLITPTALPSKTSTFSPGVAQLPAVKAPAGGDATAVGGSTRESAAVPSSGEDAVARVEAELRELRLGLRAKLEKFDAAVIEMRETNDWMRDLRDDVIKFTTESSNEFFGEDEEEGFDEVERMRGEVRSWLEMLESEVREASCSVKERKEGVLGDEAHALHSLSARMLQFNSSYRLCKLDDAFQLFGRKVAEAEEALDGISSTRPNVKVLRKRNEALNLNAEDERKVYATARNVCRIMATRRRALADLHHKFIELQSRNLGSSVRSETSRLAERAVNGVNHLPQSTIPVDTNSVCTSASSDSLSHFQKRREKLLSILSSRNTRGAHLSTANVLPLGAPEESQNVTLSNVSVLESKLLQSSFPPSKPNPKVLMDVGVQCAVVPTQKAAAEDVRNGVQSGAPPSGAAARAGEPRPPMFSLLGKLVNKPEVLVSGIPASISNAPSVGAASAVSQSPASAVAQPTAQPATQPVVPTLTPQKIEAPALSGTAFVPSASAQVSFAKPQPSLGANVQPTSKELPKPAATVAPALAETSSKPAAAAAPSVPRSVAVAASEQPAASPPTTLAAAVVETKAKDAVAVGAPSAVPVAAQPAAAPVTSSQPTAEPSPVSFTFSLPTSTAASSTRPTAVNAAVSIADSVLPQMTSDERMMDEETPTAAPSNPFSSLSLGLGSKPAPSGNTAINVFGGSLKFGTPTSQPSSLFGGAFSRPSTSGSIFGGNAALPAAGSSRSSVFGGGVAAPAAVPSGGPASFSFSSALAQSQPSQPAASAAAPSGGPTSFSFSSALSQPQPSQPQPTSLFGAKISGGPSFGGAPTFGAKPTFGSLSSSPFGQSHAAPQPAPASGSGFSAFSKGSSIGFGTIAAGQRPTSGSTFGGSGFGALTGQSTSAHSSVFGGGVNPQSSGSTGSSFTSWR